MKKLALYSVVISFILSACQSKKAEVNDQENVEIVAEEEVLVVSEVDSNLYFEIDIPTTGRYQLTLKAKASDSSSVWLEDYVNNQDNRTYNVSGNIYIEGGKGTIDGSPLAKGMHEMRFHFSDPTVAFESIEFKLMQSFVKTPEVLEQKVDGQDWNLVWSDEFDQGPEVDESKWSFNVGNWGWGNNELQYYTENKVENARIEDGNLIIEAHQIEDSKYWTSARLTTQGKVAFKYGKVEFRAKVPYGRGTWAAGWLLGDDYRDEMSWPYCGEIDVLECVGYEINDTSGNGKNHGSCHTRAYYFKQNNHITGEIDMEDMHASFHTYSIEWYKDHIKAFVDGEHYYTYDKVANEYEWPFNKAHNIILNLAIGGGWGGLKGVDSSFKSHQYIIDYVRVYEKI